MSARSRRGRGFAAQAERFTAGKVPAQLVKRLDVDLAGDYKKVIGVAHNAGDDLRAATEAVAYGVDAVEIDVRSSGGELFASHDAPVPFMEDLVFRGPSLRQAWDAAKLGDTVLLHLKERSPAYLRDVQAFLASRPLRKVIVQTGSAETLRTVSRTIPSAQRLLLVFDAKGLEALRRDRRLLETIDGVSVRDSVLTPPGSRLAQAARSSDLRVGGQRRAAHESARRGGSRRADHRAPGPHAAPRRGPRGVVAMMRTPITWSRALRALSVAVVLTGVLVFVAANFVLVDVRLFGLSIETRLAWAVVVPAALAFGAGWVYSGLRRSDRAATPNASQQRPD